MLKHGILMGLCFLAAMSTSVAGHHHFPLFFGHHHSHASVYPVAGPVYYPYAAPVYYRAPATVYQSAYVVPTAAVSVVAPPVATVRYHSYYAPSVPIYSTAGYYYAPRTTYLRPSIGYGWVSRPRDVEVELKYRRDGSYRYEVDYD